MIKVNPYLLFILLVFIFSILYGRIEYKFKEYNQYIAHNKQVNDLQTRVIKNMDEKLKETLEFVQNTGKVIEKIDFSKMMLEKLGLTNE